MDNAPASQPLLLAVEDVALPAPDLLMLAVVGHALLPIQLAIVEPVAMLAVELTHAAMVSVLLLILLLPVVIAPLFVDSMRDAAPELVPL
ncbi:hypothetical protein CFD26_108588 [Aspergillus turcosus]|uniref:Uncharacterized protein n=1 Tax=Aspergillus turcosus TaxID=1245748 RepID=A0A421DE69_9EURO|nr:hypothetical protein CFD26_108588 [Aspergillus turcosus]